MKKKSDRKSLKQESLFVRLSSFFFMRARLALVLLLILLISGGTIYSKVIKREGFPPIQVPLSFVNGFYFVNDKEVVDEQLAQPFYKIVSELDGVTKVQTTANANDFNAVVYFEDSISPESGAQSVRDAIKDKLPTQAQLNVVSIDPGSYLNKYDMLLTVYGGDGNIEELERVAEFVAKDILNQESVVLAEPQPLLAKAQNPVTGETQKTQTAFNKVGIYQDNAELNFYPAITVGIDRDSENFDVIRLSENVKEYLSNLDLSEFSGDYSVVIGADFAESITTQINSLQDNLVTGLIAVAIVSLLLISWRASLVTAIFMITVMAVTVSVLYLVGYTLNTITLFALVLSLGLFVDDATIVVESIDAAKKKKKKPLKVIKEAVEKIGAASFSGTFTTVLVFLPLAFISGILGEFIRLMPITVIIALISSLILSLTAIPVLSKFIVLQSDKESWFTRINPVAKLEALSAKYLGLLPRLLKTRKRTGQVVAVFMVLLSISGIVIALGFANKVPFNIFPASKDSDQIGITLNFPEGYTIEQAQKSADGVDEIIKNEAGDLVERVTYGSFSIVQPNARSADILVDLVPFNERNIKSPEIIEALQITLDKSFVDDTKAKVVQYDAGPPVDDYPFKVQIYNEDDATALRLAEEVRLYINDLAVTRPNNTQAKITDTNSISVAAIKRIDGKQFIEVSAAFDAEDVSALLVAAEEKTSEKFTSDYLSNNGYEDTEITYDFGQESENADSFAALSFVFPIALGLMYLLLALQFRSFLQPLLIFLAIPFTFLGVFGGLYLTDNSLSFFVMVGLIGLVGIAVNNTILLTTYTNQERANGNEPIDAISNAITKRFRPLLATTITTIVALLPLALADPFWEALAFTIIFGLASSTFFVLVSFPYYYLGFEKMRHSIFVKRATLWLFGLALIGLVTGWNSTYFAISTGLYIFTTVLLLEQWKKIGKKR